MPKGKASFINSYLISHKLGRAKILGIARALTNPILEEFSINKFPKTKNFTYAIEIGFKPGVTDNAGSTAKETVIDLLHLKDDSDLAIYTSKVFLISGSVDLNEIKKISLSLYNPLIERAYISEPKKTGTINLPLKTPYKIKKRADRY